MILETILNYLNSSRQVGHTNAVIAAANVSTVPVVIIAGTAFNADLIRRSIVNNKHKIITLSELNNLRGMKRPLLIDNSALHMLFDNAMAENKQLADKLNRISDIAS